MSYILDALRKAERDRHLGKTPSLEDVTHTPPGTAAPRVSKRLIGLVALVFGLCLLALILRPRAPAPVAPASPPSAPAAPVVSAPVPVEPAAVPAPEVPAAAQTVEDLLDPEAETDASVDQQAAATDLGAGEDEALAAATEAPARTARKTPPRLKPDESIDSAALLETQVEPEQEPVVEEMAPEQEAPEPAYKPLREMPADYRAAFTDLRVDVHVYDADPARRWVMIDGRKYIEGASLAQGARIEAITPDGIAFDLRGQTALFELRR